MKGLLSCLKKEWWEQYRTGKFFILCGVFFLLGCMNPAIAKLTPWLYDILRESLSENGMIVSSVTISDLDSWVQFFKNIPIGLIVFHILESNIFTKEYSSGTLLLALTKGLDRYIVLAAKTIILAVLWSAIYFLCFFSTYFGNKIFWDTDTTQNLMPSVVCFWVFGLFTIALAVLFSTIFSSNIGTLVGCGGCILVLYLIGLLPKINAYLPMYLTDANSLIYGMKTVQSYYSALAATLVLCIGFFLVSVFQFNRKQL